jgi:hypothetical protein
MLKDHAFNTGTDFFKACGDSSWRLFYRFFMGLWIFCSNMTPYCHYVYMNFLMKPNVTILNSLLGIFPFSNKEM